MNEALKPVGRVKQVPQSFARINNALEQLDKELSGLGDVLTPVLTPTRPTSGKGTDENSKSDNAPIAAMLIEIEARIRFLTNKVTELAERTDV